MLPSAFGPKLVRWAALLLLGLFVLVWTKPASAYSWMIRHEYSSCQTCHLDPSGAGVLTMYGRAQSEVLLRTRYGKVSDTEDPTKLGGFAFGLIKLPEQLLLQGDVRAAGLFVKPPSPTAWQKRFLLMQADVSAGIVVSRFRAGGSIGVVNEGAQAASIVSFSGDDAGAKLVSRQYWAGVALGKEDQFLLRAGRINMPFGLRILEHTAYARVTTQTDINASQQHGAALSYTDDKWRAEVMGIAGNFALRPVVLHQYGYAGYVERTFTPKVAAGVSSLITYSPKDITAQEPLFRHAHGAFVRYAPVKPFVLMAEADFLIRSPKSQKFDAGAVVFVQADVEPLQGLHLIGTLEAKNEAFANGGNSYGAWGSVMWFFLPHVDLRVDAIVRNEPANDQRYTVPSFLVQLHAFL